MEILGLAASTPRSESRLKSLFWPSVQNGTDVDYLGAQGYWVCAFVAVLSFLLSVATRHSIWGLLALVFYYLSGVGVRERSRYAAAVVLIAYAMDTLGAMWILFGGINTLQTAAGALVLRVILTALLLSNLRATWMASRWKPGSEEAMLPPRLRETWSDKFVDWLPMQLWPKARIGYCIFSVLFLLISFLGVLIIIARSGR